MPEIGMKGQKIHNQFPEYGKEATPTTDNP